MFKALIEYTFLQNALIALILSSIVCGIIGVIVIEKKLILMSGGIAHTAYGGVGLGYFMGVNPMITAIAFSLTAAFGIGAVQKRGGKHSDIIIAMFWSLGMALGIIFIALTPGYPPDINSYLFGNILAVSTNDLLAMFLLTLLIISVIIVFFEDWKIYLFDSEFAKLIGLNVKLLEYTLLIIIALSVIILMGAYGIIMMIAMLCAPSATAALLSNNLKNRMFLSSLIGVTTSTLGLIISYNFDIATSATIVITSIIMYIIVAFIKKIQLRSVKFDI